MLELDTVGVIVEARRTCKMADDDGGPLGDAGHRIDLFERLRLLAAELFADERRTSGILLVPPTAGCGRYPWPACRAGPGPRRWPARFDDQRHDLVFEGGPIDFFFQAQMPFGDKFGLAADGGRWRGQLDLGLFDGEHELGLVGELRMSKPVLSRKRLARRLPRTASRSSPPSLPMPLLLISSKTP